ncbi:hypothetical protein SMF913_13604 [Streptomyces malaysiensis]|uniref:Uncharacterized protein n=1 Tax=Streptomyces malaysiensis TaxID=92644 RepID=A0A2J7ZBL5_STRMQ|nr:hypothetical protein SMF913_13604 [Streptomyces malaysiensis]
METVERSVPKVMSFTLRAVAHASWLDVLEQGRADPAPRW